MSKLNFTSFWRFKSFIVSTFVILLSANTDQLNAQCSLACTGMTQVSLDNTTSDCMATITPEMVLNDQSTSCAAGDFYVVIEDEYGNRIAPPAGTEGPGVPAVVGVTEKNQVLKVSVIDDISGNSCWGDLVVEDKLKPVMDCTQPAGPFYCYNINAFQPVATDNCTAAADLIYNIVDDAITVNDCSQGFVDALEANGFFPDANGTTYAMAQADPTLVAYVLKIHTRTYTATDECGNVSEPCELVLFVERIEDLGTIDCPESLLVANETNLLCDQNFAMIPSGPYAGNPLPGGTMQARDYFEGTVTDMSPSFSGSSDFYEVHKFTYRASVTGATEAVTFSEVAGNLAGNGDYRIAESNGAIILSASNGVQVVNLTDGVEYCLIIGVFNASVPVAYRFETMSAGSNVVAVPEVPRYTYVNATGGVVVANTVALYPDPEIYCNLLATFADTDLGNIGCTRKIMRVWTILEWSCESPQRSRTCTQMIEISDTEGPTFTCPADYTITTNTTGGHYNTPHGTASCAAMTVPPCPVVVDNCSDETSLDITWGFDMDGDGVVDMQNGHISDWNCTDAIELPLGENIITYTAYDDCYNSTVCSVNVTVEDNTPPVAICKQFTVVSLSNDGFAHVYASVFDNGSYDDCHLVDMLVKRMDDGANCGIVEDTFQDHITLCCADIGTSVMVQFRVYDDGGFNECMVEVEVQDKIAPVVTCPPNITINCDDAYDLDGDLVTQFGAFSVTDNCGFTVVDEILSDNTNQCNVGVIRRRITATDQGGRVDACIQRITILNDNPFCITDTDCDNDDPTDGVVWPCDFDSTNGCADPTSDDFLPAVTGAPFILEDQCDLVGVNYEDLVFPFNNGVGDACFKILRTWTILDWCQVNDPTCLDPATGNLVAQWTYTQVIKVSNGVAPTITSDCAPKSTCTFDNDCLDGFIELTATATDDCTDILDWWADVDLNNTGSFDSNYATSGTGGLADASQDYPIGSHTVFFSFKDKCGNVTTCSIPFEIINCKAPVPYCINGLATDLMPQDTNGDGEVDNGMIELWASDFDNGSYHTCGYPVALSFTPNIFDTNMTFTCATMGQQSVSIYVTVVDATGNPVTLPDGSFLQSFCNTFVDIQDNMGACSGFNGGNGNRIAGNISTEDNIQVMDAEVSISNGTTNTMSDDNGMYAFPDMPAGGAYSVEVSKDTDAMNGVSTLDLVLIQKHLLQTLMLDSPYKQIAADINHDNNITAIDLIELRKLILGVTDEFNNNQPWRFVDSDYTFADANNPLDEDFTEVYEIAALNSDMTIDFTAVKVGDVNNSRTVNFDNESTENRSGQTFKLTTDNVTFSAGDRVSVPFEAMNTNTLTGYQFTMEFDTDLLELTNVTYADLNVNDSNFGKNKVSQGMISTSWNNAVGTEINRGETLFTLEFIARGEGSVSGAVEVNSAITRAEAYNVYNEIADVTLQVRTDGGVYALYQNTPNPFSSQTQIAFEIPVDQKVTINVYDVTGKVITNISNTYSAGYNTVTIDQNDLSTSGILYYTLEANGFTATKKMVVLK